MKPILLLQRAALVLVGLQLAALVLLVAVPGWRATATRILVEGRLSGSSDLPMTEASSQEPESTEPGHALALSEQALQNIGLTDESIVTSAVTEYQKRIEFPAVVVERPGRSLIKIPAPVCGVISRVYHVPGETVQAGTALFDIEINDEELIDSQAELLAAYLSRSQVEKELARLKPLGDELAPRAKRENEYKMGELDARIDSLRMTLRHYGLTDRQIERSLVQNRQMIRTYTVCVPDTFQTDPAGSHHSDSCGELQVSLLRVEKGQQVDIGDSLCTITDYCKLDIEGRAFATDEAILTQALQENGPVRVIMDRPDGTVEVIGGLHIRYIDSQIDPESRTLAFFVELPNEKAGETRDHDRWFINWRFKPGQRCRLEVAYETIDECFVFPIRALATDNAEAYLFEWSGRDGGKKVWLRRPVHVLDRTETEVAIANDGSIYPGAKIAGNGAGQLQVALTAGGGKLQNQCPCGNH